MTDYSKFDKALLAAIISKPKNFTELTTMRPLVALAQSLGAKNGFGHPVPTDRIFDRRLQALRRAGKIRYAGTKWEILP
ncbi:hypothetical protein [Castellaniella denitrificans]|uniref:Uncharacterized protein n=1 Tax=Castellaniella denitrificans TaxID=56119 RepID=A0ABT4M6U0_9BURK|nr:hypothetical protein [Castellaniella denitrificans]MCZ4331045.1 hypothetical protein [Castellaniella denitrificans]